MPTASTRKASSTSGARPRSTRCSAPRAPRFKEIYDVTPDGNWEGHTILNRLHHLGAGATARSRRSLPPMPRDPAASARAPRVRPGLDDKVLADWNGLMIAALAERRHGIRAAGLDRAARRAAFAFIARQCSPRATAGSRMPGARASARTAAMLDDYANMSRAALALHEATGDARLSRAARALGRDLRHALLRRARRRLFLHRRRCRGADRAHQAGRSISPTPPATAPWSRCWRGSITSPARTSTASARDEVLRGLRRRGAAQSLRPRDACSTAPSCWRARCRSSSSAARDAADTEALLARGRRRVPADAGS